MKLAEFLDVADQAEAMTPKDITDSLDKAMADPAKKAVLDSVPAVGILTTVISTFNTLMSLLNTIQPIIDTANDLKKGVECAVPVMGVSTAAKLAQDKIQQASSSLVPIGVNGIKTAFLNIDIPV